MQENALRTWGSGGLITNPSGNSVSKAWGRSRFGGGEGRRAVAQGPLGAREDICKQKDTSASQQGALGSSQLLVL